MALSGTINGSVTNKSSVFTFYATWSAKQSVSGNYSDVTVTTYWKTSSTSYKFDTVSERSASITINGSTTSIEKRFNLNPWPSNPYQIQTATTRVNHNSSGSATITISARANGSASSYGPSSGSGSSGDCTLSATVTLDTIARSSQPSCITWPNHTQNVGNFGDTISIHMNRNASEFTHTVRYEFGNLSGTIATNVTTGTTWTIPTSFMDLLPSATSGSGTIFVDTYNGSTLIGTKYCGFTATVPASVKPTCSVQVSDGTDIKNTYGDFIRGLSKMLVKVTGTPAYSSPIASYSTAANNKTYTTATFTTDVIASHGILTVTAKVMDSRGRSSDPASVSIDVLDYTKPTVKTVIVKRCDADGTENDEGDYILISFEAAITPLNNENSASYTLTYKSSSANTSEVEQLTSLAGNYSAAYVSDPILADSDLNYEVIIDATDNFMTTSRTVDVPTAFALMNWGTDGKSMAIGKVVNKPGIFDVALPMRTERGLTNDQNGVVSKIYSPDSSYTRYESSAEHFFDKSVRVQGDIYGGDSYDKRVQFADDPINMAIKQQVKDTRSVNSTPEYYMTTYGQGTVWEFKEAAVIGFTDPASKYCAVQTIIPWKDTSGGLPRQVTMINTQMYVRIANSETAWGAWRMYYNATNAIDATTLNGQSLSKCFNYCDSLWNGTLTSNTSISFTMDSKYSGYIILGKTNSSSYHVSMYIPRWLLNSTNTSYQIVDNVDWVGFALRTDGTLVYLTKQDASSTNGCIVRVMGVS